MIIRGLRTFYQSNQIRVTSRLFSEWFKDGLWLNMLSKKRASKSVASTNNPMFFFTIRASRALEEKKITPQTDLVLNDNNDTKCHPYDT